MTLATTATAFGLLLFIAVLASPAQMSFATNPTATDPPLDQGTVIHTTSAGVTLEVDFFPGGIMRFRARPPPKEDGTPVYQVTDVVVGKRLSPGPRKAEDIDPEERITNAPAGKFICGTASGGSGNAVCMVTSPCGSTSLKIGELKPGENGNDGSNPAFEYIFSHKNYGTLVQGTLTARPEGPQGTLVFPQANALYGIPERAVDLALKAGGNYRLINLDVFKYQLDSQSGIYGTIPFLMAHTSANNKATVGVLWLNSGDTTVETKTVQNNAEGGDSNNNAGGGGWYSKWTSEHGLPDVFFFPGPKAGQVQRQHASVVGPTMLPPLFALGYHQCRWNYRSEEDTLEVDHGFEVHDIPYDVLWLDIEHTDGKRYFTWDKYNFPNPKDMINKVASKGRKMVTITDPHIKVDSNYHVHREASAKGFYVKNEGGNSDFEGHCWPGTSSWVDFYNSEARKWYATLFHYDRYEGSTPDLYSWIDMNEPSVFNAHEVTMSKSAVHSTAGGRKVLHGALHNMYGYYHTMAAYEGHLLRNSIAPYVQKRPFILTRSFFSGSQRYAAMWTGDNMARWDHLEKSLPMLLALSLSNYIFVGADVGGFFDNPDAQLMTRWYQAAVFYPFFRGHAHLETKRREPWLFGEETTTRIRDAIVLRYTLLPYYYSQFFLAHDQGDTVMRPLFFEFPEQLQEQRAFMVGPALLSCPVTRENAETHEVPLPASSKWFSYPSGKPAVAGTIQVTIDTIPVYLRAGHIIPTRQRTRRSTAGTINDPLTLFVAVDNSETGAATLSKGIFYHDAGDGFEYKSSGAFLLQEFVFDAGKRQLVSNPVAKAPGSGVAASADFAANNKHLLVEKVVFFGLPNAEAIKKATASNLAAAGADGVAAPEIEFDSETGALTVKRSQLPIGSSWTLSLE